jgi:hypothetical protein
MPIPNADYPCRNVQPDNPRLATPHPVTYRDMVNRRIRRGSEDRDTPSLICPYCTRVVYLTGLPDMWAGTCLCGLLFSVERAGNIVRVSESLRLPETRTIERCHFGLDDRTRCVFTRNHRGTHQNRTRTWTDIESMSFIGTNYHEPMNAQSIEDLQTVRNTRNEGIVSFPIRLRRENVVMDLPALQTTLAEFEPLGPHINIAEGITPDFHGACRVDRE